MSKPGVDKRLVVAIIIAIVIFMVVVIVLAYFGLISKAVATLLSTSCIAVLFRKNIEDIKDVIINNKTNKRVIDEEIKNNTTDDNYNFGLKFIKRRRDKNNRK